MAMREGVGMCWSGGVYYIRIYNEGKCESEKYFNSSNTLYYEYKDGKFKYY